MCCLLGSDESVPQPSSTQRHSHAKKMYSSSTPACVRARTSHGSRCSVTGAARSQKRSSRLLHAWLLRSHKRGG
eukprot:6192697-Pleurochrysis_carterae.AAC.6